MASVPYHVAQAFAAGRKDSAGAFVTDGKAIYSYSMRLAHKEGSDIVYDYKPMAHGNSAPSVTTARHMRALEYTCPPPGPIAIRRNPAGRHNKAAAPLAAPLVGWPFIQRGDDTFRFTLGGTKGAEYEIGTSSREGGGLTYFAPGSDYGETIASDAWHAWKLVAAAIKHANKFHPDLVAQASEADGYFKNRWQREGNTTLLPDTIRYNPSAGVKQQLSAGLRVSRTKSAQTPYEAAIRHADDHPKEPATVEHAVSVNRYGKVFVSHQLTAGSPILLSNADRDFIAALFRRPRPVTRNPAMSTPIKAAIGVGLLAAIGGAAWYFTKDKKTA